MGQDALELVAEPRVTIRCIWPPTPRDSAELARCRRQGSKQFGAVDKFARDQVPHLPFGLLYTIDREQRSAERFLPKLLQQAGPEDHVNLVRVMNSTPFAAPGRCRTVTNPHALTAALQCGKFGQCHDQAWG